MKVHRLSPEYLLEVGTRIKTVRTYLKYDQKMLAQYLRTAASQMSKIEAGKAEPGIYHLLMIKKLADTDEYLRENLTWTWLLEGKGKGVFYVADHEQECSIVERRKSTMKDRLYLLKPNFLDQGKAYFCPGCAQVEGMLSFYPPLREKIEVFYIEFPRPRPSLVAEIGEDNQGCPKLVLGGEYDIPEKATVGEVNGRRFISAPLDICRYLASAYRVGEPH